jgi:hypothetical protein
MVINLLHVVKIGQQARQKASHEQEGSSHFDLDLAGRLRFALGHDNVQHTVLVSGSNLVHVDLAGELDGARKDTARSRSLSETFGLGEGVLLDVRPDREQVIADGDVQILWPGVRDLRLEEEVVLCLRQFQIGLLAKTFQQQW